jgi:hypothetical protein
MSKHVIAATEDIIGELQAARYGALREDRRCYDKGEVWAHEIRVPIEAVELNLDDIKPALKYLRDLHNFSPPVSPRSVHVQSP